MAPEYDLLHDNLQKNRDDVIVARLEGSINEDISMIYEVSSFPKIVVFKPNSVEIRANFIGKRTAEQMEKWIEKVAPKIEKTNIQADKGEKFVKKEENSNNESNDKNSKNDKNVKVNNNEDVEFIRRELDNMKNKVLNMEEEIKNLKNYSIKLNSELNEAKSANLNKVNIEKEKEIKNQKDKDKDNENHNNLEGLNEEMKLKLNALNEKRSKKLENYTIADYILYFCIFLFFIGAIITARKIFFASNKTIIPAVDHPKV
jgi:hypothetical protein